MFTHGKERGGRNPTVLTISSAITASWRAAEVHKIGCDPSGISAGFPHLFRYLTMSFISGLLLL